MRCLCVIAQPDSSLSARKTFRRFGRPNQCTPSPRPIIFSVYDESSRTVIIISFLFPRRSVCVHLCRGYLLSVSLARGFGTRRSEAWRRIFGIDLGLSSRWNIVLVCRTVSQCRAASSGDILVCARPDFIYPATRPGKPIAFRACHGRFVGISQVKSRDCGLRDPLADLWGLWLFEW